MRRVMELDIVHLAVGMALGSAFAPAPTLLGFGGALAAAAGRLVSKRRWMTAAVGFLAASALVPAAPHTFDERVDVDVVGTISDGPRASGDTFAYELRLEAVEGEAVEGAVRLYLPHAEVFDGPIRVWARCQAMAPAELPHVRSARERWAARGFGGTCSALEPVERMAATLSGSIQAQLTRRRLAVESTLKSVLSRRAGAPIAMLTGTRGHMWPSEVRAHQRAGTAHLLAISGLHFGALAGIVWACGRAFFSTVPRVTRTVGARRASAGFVAVVMFGYLIAVGAPVSAVRAYIACCALMLGTVTNRRPSGLAALALAVVVLVGGSPRIIWDLGFQLSVCATLAITLFWTRRPHFLRSDYEYEERPWLRRLRGVATFAMMSGVATAATMPLLLGATGEWSRIAFVTNLFAVPVVSMVIFPLLLAGLSVNALFGSAALLELAGEGLLRLTLVIDDMAAWPGAVLTTGSADAWWVWSATAIVFVAVADRCRLRSWAPLVGLYLALPFATPSAPQGARIHFIPVGQGDATLVETSDQVVLVDAGGRRKGLDPGRAIVAPYLRRAGIPRLDAIIVSHLDTDHAQGVPGVLDELGLARVISEPTETLPGFDISRLVEVGSKNDRSLVVRFTTAGLSTLLTGDIEQAGEEAWVDSKPSSIDLLKVPHHGSKTSSSETFLKVAAPRAAVVSAGRNNRYGHPAPEVARRYREFGIPLYSTAKNGLILAEIGPNGTFRLLVRRP